MLAIPWQTVTVEELARDLVQKLEAFPWNLYDGVADNFSTQVTLLDCAVSICMGSNFRQDREVRDFDELKAHLKPSIDKMLSKYDTSVALWENTRVVHEFLSDFTEIIQGLSGVRNWRAAKLTKVLHRKRPQLIPMLDANVQMTYNYGPRSMNMWVSKHPEDKELSLDLAVSALHELRSELSKHIADVREVIRYAHSQAPSIIPRTISPVRCLESIVYWRNR